jgi:hypothetical protein
VRRVLVSIAVAAMLLVGTAGATVAQDPVRITVSPSASLVARGAGINVTYSFVCADLGTDPANWFATSYVTVNQAVSKKLLAHGYTALYNQNGTLPLVCDGTTVNMVTALVSAGTTDSYGNPVSFVPFKKGQALVTVSFGVQDYSGGSESAEVVVTVGVK